MKIAIGYDGSEYAKAAVDDLHRSGLPRVAHALILCVGEMAVPLRPTDVTVDPALSRRVTASVVQGHADASLILSEAQQLAEDGKRRTQQQFPEWDCSAEVLVGTAAPALIERSEGWDADLVVVGSQGRSTIGRLVLGSVSKQVATESSRSVLVSRHVVDRGDAALRIMIGVDGSAHAAAAAKVIQGRVWPEGTKVRIVAVDDTVRPTGTARLVPTAAAWVSDSNAAHLQNVRDMVDSTAETFRRAALQVSAEFKHGSAQRLLCEEAASWGADCIFVGSRGLGSAVERLRLGSVSTALVTSAPCSVEVVRTRLERP